LRSSTPIPRELHATIARMCDERQAAIERAKAHGIDISLLEAALRLTPTERVRRGQDFAWFAWQVHEQGRLAREKQRQDAAQLLRETADDAGG
jgi:hypothetical protein